MRDKILLAVLPALINTLLSLVTEERVKLVLNKVLDTIEEKIVASENKIDDASLWLVKVLKDIVNN